MVPLLILAGGRATRLGPHSDDRPKFLMPLGDGRVFADLQLAWVHAQGFREVVLSLGYRAEMIREAIGDGSRYGLAIRYVEDGASPLGTGGALKKAMGGSAGPVAILYGDTMLDLDCPAVVRAAAGAYALMTVLACPANEKPNARLEGTRVDYDKRHPDPRWPDIDYGLSVVSPEFLAALPDTTPFDLAEAFTAASREGRLQGFRATRPFREINTPEALDAFRAWARGR